MSVAAENEELRAKIELLEARVSEQEGWIESIRILLRPLSQRIATEREETSRSCHSAYPFVELPWSVNTTEIVEPGTSRNTSREWTIEGWEHLVHRPHPWRRQPYLKGRNLTVRQLLGTIQANGLSVEEAAEDLDLPPEAIREAMNYAELHHDLLAWETAFESLFQSRKRAEHEPINAKHKHRDDVISNRNSASGVA